MPFWPVDIRMAVHDLGELLGKIEDAVESEVTRRHEECEACLQTPTATFGTYELLADQFITAADHYRLWAYGGFVSTALAWLNDRLLMITDFSAHSSSAVLASRHGNSCEHREEPSLYPILSKWLEDEPLRDRIKLWIAVRNRFIHSLGAVANRKERENMTNKLGVCFDADARMQLMADNCRALLKDIEAVGVAIAEKADVFGMLDASRLASDPEHPA